MSAYTQAWIAAFLLTQAVEGPIYYRAARGRRPLYRVIIAFTPSLLTHPVVWFVIPDLMVESSYEVYFLTAEGFAVAAEAVFLWTVRVRPALAWAVLANAASVVVGLITRALFAWP